jgi:hypothetical protein
VIVPCRKPLFRLTIAGLPEGTITKLPFSSRLTDEILMAEADITRLKKSIAKKEVVRSRFIAFPTPPS